VCHSASNLETPVLARSQRSHPNRTNLTIRLVSMRISRFRQAKCRICPVRSRPQLHRLSPPRKVRLPRRPIPAGPPQSQTTRLLLAHLGRARAVSRASSVKDQLLDLKSLQAHKIRLTRPSTKTPRSRRARCDCSEMGPLRSPRARRCAVSRKGYSPSRCASRDLPRAGAPC
jgi:hypothetical protein